MTAVHENGESDPSNEDRASEPCGSAAAMALPGMETTAVTESGGDPKGPSLSGESRAERVSS